MRDYNTLSYKTQIKSDYLGESLFNLLDKTFEMPFNGFTFNVLVVSDEYIARPDLIAYDAYGDSGYADIICKINGISNPFELNLGMQIIVPRPEDINKFTSTPALDDTESDGNTAENIPQAKSKSSKRKANEAVIGDQRFRINSSSKIVVY